MEVALPKRNIQKNESWLGELLPPGPEEEADRQRDEDERQCSGDPADRRLRKRRRLACLKLFDCTDVHMGL